MYTERTTSNLCFKSNFKLTSTITMDSEIQKKDASGDLPDASSVVAGTRLELATFGL
jgi:hypothetical protein